MLEKLQVEVHKEEKVGGEKGIHSNEIQNTAHNLLYFQGL